MSRGHILIVDDEENIRSSLEGILKDEGYTISQASDGDEALALLDRVVPDVVLLDVWLPGLNGIQALQAVRKQQADLEVIMMSGHANIETAVKATKLGAFDFIEKPLSLDQVVHTVELALRQHRLFRENSGIRSRLDQSSELIGRSRALFKLWQTIESCASGEGVVLIYGETGTGKELVARLIQERRSGVGQPFLRVDCGDGTSDPLSLKQRTFGLEGPSGEVQAGALEAAGEGAVYLHGAERMNSEVAVLLAEALESGEFRREGGRRPLPMKAGVILSTTADLQITPIKELFDREIGALISHEPVRVPPLRERWEDIPSLCEHFLSQYCSHHGLRRPVIAEEAMEAMEKHSWPDNIKGLMNTIEWLIAQETGEVVEVDDLPGVLRGIAEKETEDRPTVQVRERRKWAKGDLRERLKKNNGNLRKTASELGISEGDLRAGIADDRPGASSGRAGAGVAQRTLGKSVLLSGQGLHSGLKTGLILSPLQPDSGIRFGSITTEETVPAHLDNVVSTDFATTLQRGNVKVRTIEHLMSTLHAYGVHNLLIKVENEIPIMDGSALEFCRLIDEAGVIEQEASLEPLKIRSAVEVVSERPGQEPAVLKIEPHAEFKIEFQFLLPKPIGMQKFSYTLDGPESFRNAIAPARTFGEIKEAERQGKRGLIGGGRLDNVILLDAGRVINTELRFPDEFVRHKVLDVIGDLYLLGRPLRGKVTARMSGHTENIELLRKIQTA